MIWTAEDAREIDRLSSEVYGIPSLKLMEEAGQAIYRLALSLWKPHHSFLILAGPGNNGGDALVTARLLWNAGFRPVVIDVSAGNETAERTIQRERLTKLSCPLLWPHHIKSVTDTPIIIDGLLGIGLKGRLRPGPIQDALSDAHQLKAKIVLAIDLPSGMEANRFSQTKPILRATHTLTFGALKPLHVGHPARLDCGEISLAAVGFAQAAVQKVTSARRVQLEHCTERVSLKKLWDHLPVDAHKYDRGHVLAVGGSPGKVGAILHSANAAWRAGAGWVTVAPLSDHLSPPLPAIFTYESFGLNGPINDSEMLTFIEERRVKAVLIGPGTMKTPLSRGLLEKLCQRQRKTGLRLIFDAGACDQFLTLSQGLDFQSEHTLLTPHPGEWKKLSPDVGALVSIDDIERALPKLNGLSVIFKSSTPIVLREGQARFLTQGDNRLSRAGTGDALAGLILGLAGTPLPIDEIAAIAQNLMTEPNLILSYE